MQTVRTAIVSATMTVVGILAGVLSAVALGLAAVVPPILGLLAVLLSPFRAILERLRGSG